MKKKYQNAFLIFGLIVLAIMVSQLNFKEVGEGISRAGYWFLAVVLLWLFSTASTRRPGGSSSGARSVKDGRRVVKSLLPAMTDVRMHSLFTLP